MTAEACRFLRHAVIDRWVGDIQIPYCATCECLCSRTNEPTVTTTRFAPELGWTPPQAPLVPGAKRVAVAAPTG